MFVQKLRPGLALWAPHGLMGEGAEVRVILASASPYLRLWGTVACGLLLAKGARAYRNGAAALRIKLLAEVYTAYLFPAAPGWSVR